MTVLDLPANTAVRRMHYLYNTIYDFNAGADGMQVFCLDTDNIRLFDWSEPARLADRRYEQAAPGPALFQAAGILPPLRSFFADSPAAADTDVAAFALWSTGNLPAAQDAFARDTTLLPGTRALYIHAAHSPATR